MAPQTQALHVPAGLPFDESMRAELVDVGQSNRSNVNVRMWETGSLGKRLGYSALSTTRADGTSRTSGARMFPCGVGGTELAIVDNSASLDVYSPTLARSANKGPVPEAMQSPVPVPSLGIGSTILADVAYVGGYSFLAWSTTTTANLYASFAVLDAATNAVIRSPEILGPAMSVTPSVRLATYSTYAIAVLFGGDGNVRAWYLDTASASTVATGWVSIGILGADFGLGKGSAVAISGGIAICYNNTGGGTTRLTVKTVTIAGVVSSTTLTTAASTPEYPDIVEGGTTLWVSWGEGGTIQAQGLNPSGLATTATKLAIITAVGGTTDIRVSPMGSGNAAVFVNTVTLAYARAIKVNAGATATNGSLGTFGNAKIMGRPFLYNGKIYAHWTSRRGDELVLCECTPDTTAVTPLSMYLRPVATPVVRGIYVRGLDGGYNGSRSAVVSSTQFLFGYDIKRSGTTTGSAAVLYDFANPYRWRNATVDGSTAYIAGGVASTFDNARVAEAAFLSAPFQPNPSSGSAGAITWVAGGAKYVLTFADIDANGNLHVSGVSLPTGPGNVAAKQINVGVLPLCISARGLVSGSHLVYGGTLQSSLRILVWRTTDGGNPPYYYVGEVTNDPASTALTFVDNTTDAALSSNALLYGTGSLPGTNGSSQDRRAPPGLSYVASYNGMLVGAAGSVLWYSSQPIDGEGQWFSPVFTVPFDEVITALAVQDGTLYVFTRNGMFAVSGDPPSDNAALGGLGVPRKLSVNRGCVDANSVLATELGIVFESDLGVEIFSRSQSVEFIGRAFQNTLETWPIVSSAVLDTRNALIRVTLAASQTAGVVSASGVDVVYDITNRAWVSRDSKMGGTAQQASQDACIALIGGVWRYCWLATNGVVYVEHLITDADKCLDGGTFVTAQYELPSMKTGLQAEQRVFDCMALFERHSAAGLTIEVANDYGAYAAITPDKVWTEAETLGKHQLEFRPHARGSAVQMRVKDTAPAVLGTGEGFTFIGISADIAPLQGPTRALPRLAVGDRK